MVIDGRKIAAEIKAKLAVQAGVKPTLALVLVGEDPASATFVKVKKKFGEAIGTEVKIFEYEENISQPELEEVVTTLVNKSEITGIVVQLPLPTHLNSDKILGLITPAKDVDALGQEPRVLSPVVGAVKEILDRNKINLAGKKAVVIGRGKLVGQPVAIWLTQEGAEVKIADSKTQNLPELLAIADIIISGAGVPHFINPEMIKTGVILIDAATSDLPAGEAGANGKLAGDADPACADKCSIFTPVPGGVGPITVAKLFENLFDLVRM